MKFNKNLEPKKIYFKGFVPFDWEARDKIKTNDKEYSGEWIEGNLYRDFFGKLEIEDYTIVPETLGQFTGYNLVDGTKIYENDIVQITLHTGIEISYLNDKKAEIR